METTQSADGTIIAYDRSGTGPPLVVVMGAFCNRHTTKSLSALLREHFTVFEYDRRGRGDSGDTRPYAVEREIEDLAALLDVAGGAASIYGHSSGAALALEAASRGLPVTRLLAYEPPYTTPDDGQPSDLHDRISAHIDAGRRREAVEAFLTEAAGVPVAALPVIESGPDFGGMLAVSHTLPYDFAVCGDGRVPANRLTAVGIPVLVGDGGASPPWAGRVAQTIAAVAPHAERRTFPGQSHRIADDVITPVLVEFLGAG